MLDLICYFVKDHIMEMLPLKFLLFFFKLVGYSLSSTNGFAPSLFTCKESSFTFQDFPYE